MTYPTPAELLPLLPEFLQHPDPSVYQGSNYVVLDFETTTTEYGSPHAEFGNRVLLASWRCGPTHPDTNKNVQRLVGSEYDLHPLIAAIEQADFIVAHNTKFELGWLHRAGCDIGRILPFCTMLGERALAGNRPWSLHLADCLRKRGLEDKDPIGRLIRLGVDTESIPKAWLGDYCDKDVILTEELFLIQREELAERNLLPVCFTRNILTPVLFNIETYGLHLDAERVDAVHKWHVERKMVLDEEWNKLTGGVNYNSPAQKRELFFDTLKIPPPKDETGKVMMTKGGKSGDRQISTDGDAMKALKPRSKKAIRIVELFREVQAVSQALSKVVSKMKACVEDGSMLYATFSQATADTHRLSSSGRPPYGTQLQNFPKPFRACVKPRTENWFIGDGDAAGIEFRTAVDLSRDIQGGIDLRDPDFDPHGRTASILYEGTGWDPSKGAKEGSNKDLRDNSKPETFKPLYGGQSGTERQKAYFAAFRERYPEIAAMQEAWVDEVLKAKKLTIPCSGLIFHWPGCKMTESGYILHTTNIYNYPIQSTATAEMCPTATVYLWHLMRAAKMQSFLINLVHDSSVGEIHPDEREQWASYAAWCYNEFIVWYLKQVYDYEWITPLDSEVAINTYWGSSNEDWSEQWEQAA